MSEETKSNITAPRVRRIEDLLKKEPVIAERFSGEKEAIKQRDGKSSNFCVESVRVTERIHADGGDAYTMGKDDVLKIARSVMGITGDGSVAAAPATTAPSTTANSSGNNAKIYVNPAISIVSLLLSAKSIAEHADKCEDSKARADKLDQLIADYTKLYESGKLVT